MKRVLVVAGITACFLSAPAFADGLANAKKAGCMNCHAVEMKLVGPAYKEVAAKYKGDAAAEGKLLKKLNDGGSGTWGTMPMPTQKGKMTDAEFKETLGWILSL